MKKVIIIGCPGSGKSTFAKKLQPLCGLPLYHLDLLYWNADRTHLPKEEFRAKLQDLLQEEAWIIDGNYKSTMELRMQFCDTVFYLDYPAEVCLSGMEARKGKVRTDMPWTEAVDEVNEEFVTLIKQYNTDSRPDVLQLLEQYSDKNIVVFHSREEAEEYLQQ